MTVLLKYFLLNIIWCISVRVLYTIAVCRSMKLISPTDFESILAQLNEEDDKFSIPLRYVIVYCLKGLIKQISLYADDEYPKWNVLLSAYTVAPGTAYNKLHLALHIGNKEWKKALAAQNPEAVSLKTESLEFVGQFQNFLKQLLVAESFVSRKFSFMAIRQLYADSIFHVIKEVFGTKFNNVKAFKDFVLCVYESNVVNLKQLLTVREKALDGSSLMIDNLRVSDVHHVLKFWDYAEDAGQGADAWFMWLFTSLPTSCIRNRDTGAISGWSLTYDYGGEGARFVHPEYRFKGLGKIVSIDRATKAAEFSGLPYYAIVHSSNEVSFNSNAFITVEANRNVDDAICFILN